LNFSAGALASAAQRPTIPQGERNASGQAMSSVEIRDTTLINEKFKPDIPLKAIKVPLTLIVSDLQILAFGTHSLPYYLPSLTLSASPNIQRPVFTSVGHEFASKTAFARLASIRSLPLAPTRPATIGRYSSLPLTLDEYRFWPTAVLLAWSHFAKISYLPGIMI